MRRYRQPTGHGPAFVLCACLLLLATLAWHLPLMLWDHIDLVPMYDAWQQGRPGDAGFWRVHDGSHLHVAGYAVLLLTTRLSAGQPWLDCVASWLFLLVQAWLLMRMVADRPGAQGAGGWRFAFVLLALYPGHLVNLQWGWQVSVFVSTLGAVLAIRLLTIPALGPGRNLAALASACIGVLGFSTTLAVFPVALLLIAARAELPWARRIGRMLPWALAAALLAWWLQGGRADLPAPSPGALALYVMNYLGAGVSRFADGLAPAWTAVALLTALLAILRAHLRASAPWLALMLFAMGCAALTALGRAATFGPDHAFVTRYVSVSSLFWFGWLGMMLATWRRDPVAWRRWVRPLLSLWLLFAVVNALHMGKQAVQVHARAQAHAAHLRAHWPAPDPAVMDAAYGARAVEAHARLGRLHAWGFAPFDAPPPAGP